MAVYFTHRCGRPSDSGEGVCRERVTSNSKQIDGSWWTHSRERFAGVHFDHRAGDVISEKSAPVPS